MCNGKSVPLSNLQKSWLGKPAVLGASASLSILSFAGKQALSTFSFRWSKVDDDFEPPDNCKKPNILTFQSVSEGDHGYYQYEVKEAGKVVLTVYRALYKEEPESPILMTVPSRPLTPSVEANHNTDHDTVISTASSTAYIYASTPTGEKTQHFLKASNLSIDNSQLDIEIEPANMSVYRTAFR